MEIAKEYQKLNKRYINVLKSIHRLTSEKARYIEEKLQRAVSPPALPANESELIADMTYKEKCIMKTTPTWSLPPNFSSRQLDKKFAELFPNEIVLRLQNEPSSKPYSMGEEFKKVPGLLMTITPAPGSTHEYFDRIRYHENKYLHIFNCGTSQQKTRNMVDLIKTFQEYDYATFSAVQWDIDEPGLRFHDMNNRQKDDKTSLDDDSGFQYTQFDNSSYTTSPKLLPLSMVNLNIDLNSHLRKNRLMRRGKARSVVFLTLYSRRPFMTFVDLPGNENKDDDRVFQFFKYIYRMTNNSNEKKEYKDFLFNFKRSYLLENLVSGSKGQKIILMVNAFNSIDGEFNSPEFDDKKKMNERLIDFLSDLKPCGDLEATERAANIQKERERIEGEARQREVDASGERESEKNKLSEKKFSPQRMFYTTQLQADKDQKEDEARSIEIEKAFKIRQKENAEIYEREKKEFETKYSVSFDAASKGGKGKSKRRKLKNGSKSVKIKHDLRPSH
jgi:hypothetical protein